MLNELVKKDKYFRNIAFSMCGDWCLSKDLVQDMYVKIYDYKKDIKNLDNFAYRILRNLFIDSTKSVRCIDIDFVTDYIEEETESSIDFEPDDTELNILHKASKLSFVQRNLLVESYDKSYREIEKEFKINYGYSFRECDKARREVLGDDYDTKYNNKRLKYKK